jgi:C-type lectin domain family 10 protein A
MTDTRRDGSWVWESTMTLLSAGNYTHWFPGRPIRAINNVDDCMMYGGDTFFNFWGDINCGTLARGICEVKP